MARGRRPADQNVVPMKGEAPGGHNLQERAVALATELRPEGLPTRVRWIYDRLAPPLCLATRKHPLNTANVTMFVMLCRSVARYEHYETLLDELGETYVSQGRQGQQIKARPEIAQLNETWRQIRALASDFGMTPASERALGAGGQMGFDFDDDDDGFS
ncbi:P27 family phage terminase small subunit [Nioella sp.]|uniref:P27 family phage terminase small subunit n=1 Tax=Nioella sp. TaxID=1912091 RepID=UPI003512322A